MGASSFNLHVKSGGDDVTGSPQIGSATGIDYTLNPGSYTVSEDSPTSLGYGQTGFSGDCNSDGVVTVVAGQTKTCTITNNDISPTLKLVKDISGGTSVPHEWTLSAQSNGAGGFSDWGDSTTFHDVNANISYALSEDGGPAGYSPSLWTCDNDVTVTDSSINLPLNKDVTCTITNTQETGTIELKKAWSGTGGQTTLNIGTTEGGTDIANVQTGADGEGPLTTGTKTVNSGTYYLSESGGLTNYARSLICTDDGKSVTPGTNDEVSVAKNHTVVCTFTNTRDQGYIIVSKMTDKGNGEFVSDDRSFKWGFASDNTPYEMGAELLFDTGPYNLYENTKPNYHSVGWFWTNGGGSCESPDGTEFPVSVDVVYNEPLFVTFCNARDTGRLKVVKTVNDDSDLTQWSFSLPGRTAISANADGEVDFGQVLTDTSYLIQESGPDGYHFVSVTGTNCSSDNSGEANATVTKGETTTCTFTNNRDTGTITIDKVTNPTGDSTDFNFNILSTDTGINQNTTLKDQDDPFSGTFDTGFYTIEEKNIPTGWDLTDLVCDQTATVDKNTHTATFDLSSGEDIKCTFTNTQRGNIVIHKLIDADGDLETTEDQSPASDWQFGVSGEDYSDSGTTNGTGTVNFNLLKTGSYDLSETVTPGYELIDAYCDRGENGSRDGDTIYGVDVSANGTVNCTFINAPNGTIHGYKWNDSNGNETQDGVESVLSGWTIDLYKNNGEDGYDLIDSMQTADSSSPHFGWYWFEHLYPGDYKVCEELKSGWKQTYPTTEDKCHLVSLPDDNSGGKQILPNAVAESPAYNFGNQQFGEVNVTKYNDKNGDGVQDEGENVLGDWTINLGDLSQKTDENGQTSFSITPGEYILSEDIQPGWMQTNISCNLTRQDLTQIDTEKSTFGLIKSVNAVQIKLNPIDNDNNYPLMVDAGQTINCKIGNRMNNPILQISKSNDASGDKSPGGNVIYTLKVKALNSKVLGVTLKDLLPKGFSFDHIVSSTLNGSPITLGDPGYHSPGTYNLGDLNADDEVIIQYQANISGSQAFGLYKDVAWAQGTDLLSNKILALAQPEGKVSDNFVGTGVRVNGEISEEGKVNIASEGQVLGASTSILPATGGNSIWVYLGSILSIFGLLIMAFAFMIKRKKFNSFIKNIFTMVFVGLVFAVVTGNVSASDLSIRISEPKTPTRLNNFTIDFVTIDLSDSGLPITVKCFYKKNLADAWTQYGSDITVAAPGNNGSCQEVSSFVNTSGTTYYFKNTATNGVISDDSELQGLIAVDYDQRSPSVPTNYKKEKISSCQYKISFKTADDGMTSRVEVYRSENTTMSLDGSTRVGDVTVGPNTDSSFTEAVPDCNKTYYYVIRAFNVAGNPSGPTGDSVTITSTTTVVNPTTGALPVENVTLPAAAGGGSVLGENTKEGSKEAAVKEEVVNVGTGNGLGKVLGAATKKENRLYVVLAIIGLAIIGYGTYYFIKKNKKNSV